MSGRPPELAPRRLLAALLIPLALYLVLRYLTGSATEALALTEAIPAAWLVVAGIARRRIDPIGIIATGSVAIALVVYALTGGDPVALKLRYGVVTGAVGLIALSSLGLGRPLLLVIAQHRAEIDVYHRAEIEARLADPERRRALVILTLLIGAFFTVDGIVQAVLVFAVPTSSFVPDSTAAHVFCLGTGIATVIWYFQRQKQRRLEHRSSPSR